VLTDGVPKDRKSIVALIAERGLLDAPRETELVGDTR
jgi:hypothetical protein